MKKLKFIALLTTVVLIASSCYKDPPKTYDDTDMTVTLYDTSFNFNAYNTFIMPDSTVLTTNIEDFNVGYFYSDGGSSEQTLELVRSRFLDLGYQEVDSLDDADFIPVPTMLMMQSDETIYYTPGWWWGYYGYGWGWGYYKNTNYYGWYPVYPWYPAYPVTVSTYVGTIVTEMVDAESYRQVLEFNENNPDPGSGDDAPPIKIRWQAFIEGYLTDDGDYNSDRAVRGFNEAIAQSPYLSK